MKYKFEEFKESGSRSGDFPIVTITRSGNFNFNKRFMEEFWTYIEGGYLIFHYDKENRVIGLEMALEWKPNSYPMRLYPSRKTCTVSARAFLKFYSIPFDKARSYKITRREGLEDENDFYIIDLKKELKK